LTAQYGNTDSPALKSLKYAISDKRGAEMPSETAKIFRGDGYAFWRSSWESPQATWIMLKSGFLSLTHKHRDELSVYLFAKGAEIFTDPGMYNYMVGNVIHDYMNSVFAHNGIIVDNASYPIGKSLTDRAGILETADPCKTAHAYNNLYPNVYIDRRLVYVNEHEFYIADDIFSKDNHSYQQNFHLSNDVELVRHGLSHSVIKIKGTDWNVCIVQHEPAKAATSKHGETGNAATMSVMSAGLNHVLPTTSIQFAKSGSCVRFITKIAIVSDGEVEECLQSPLIFDGTDIAPRTRALPVPVSVSLKAGQLCISNEEIGKNGSAYYLLDKNTAEVAYSLGYSAEGERMLPLPKSGSYMLRAYTRAAETVYFIAGELQIKGESLSFVPVPLEKSIPYIQKRKYSGKNNSYKFKLIHQIPWDCTVSWYVYKNGAGYDYKNGNAEFNYTFTESGVYSIIYRFNVKYFYEIEFGNFPEIHISDDLGKCRNLLRTLARGMRRLFKRDKVV
jgi:hypothetical protein